MAHLKTTHKHKGLRMNVSPIVEAVRSAARLCEAIGAQARKGISKYSERKGLSEPVTIADYGAQAVIGRALAHAFPHDAVIAEESGTQFLRVLDVQARNDALSHISETLGIPVSEAEAVAWLDAGKGRTSPRTWVIDPIDGTKGFISGRHYAVCIGYLEDGVPKGGVMACPHYGGGAGMLFYTTGDGVYQQPLEGGTPVLKRVSARQSAQAWVAVQSYEDAQMGNADAVSVLTELGLEDVVRVESIDSMEKYARVAVGDADMLIRRPRRGSVRHMIWDHVAGVALVLAGGGRVSDYDGAPLDFTRGVELPNEGMLASSGIMHDDLVRAAVRLGVR
jgi:3'(2'), 5'-bisphosphate nucleotidase